MAGIPLLETVVQIEFLQVVNDGVVGRDFDLVALT